MEFQKAKGKKENTVNNALVVAEIVLVVAATIVISLYVRKILDEKIQQNAPAIQLSDMEMWDNHFDSNVRTGDTHLQRMNSSREGGRQQNRVSLTKYNPNAMKLARRNTIQSRKS